MADDIVWYAGLDWGGATHWVCLLNAQGGTHAEHRVTHGGAGLAELCRWLCDTTQAAPAQIAVAIETPHGPVVDALLAHGVQVYALNPKQLDRFRDRFTTAGAKDDRRDALVLASALRTDRHAFRQLAADDPRLIQLREVTHMAEELKRERIRLTNRLREQLWRYFPQMLQLPDELHDEWFLTLWLQAPTPAKAARLHKETLARLLKAHRIRRLDADAVHTILHQPALPVAPGVTEAATTHIRSLISRIRLANQQIKQVDQQIDALCTALAPPQTAAAGDTPSGQRVEQRDGAILRSLPGLGRLTLATLLAEATEPLRRRDYHALRALCGAAPVTKRSGKTRLVLRRLACNKRLANALYHWARTASMHDPRSRVRYAELRRRGHTHGRALRTVGDRLLALACTLLTRQVLFDPAYPARQETATA
jgi:transposase